MVSPQATIPAFADPRHEGTLVSSPSLHLGRIGVFMFTPSPSDEEPSLISDRRESAQPSQQPGAPSYPSLNAPAESLYATANVPYPQPFAGYPGQYMMLNMAHTPPAPFSYTPYASDRPPYTSPMPPSVQSSRQPSPGFPPAFTYPYQVYPQQSASFFQPPAMYSHQHQHTYPLYPSSPVGEHPDGNEYHASRPPSTPSSSGAPSLKQSGPDKPLVRRVYHPNPPAHRSEWVMWMGNVPSDAGHDELLHFLTRPLDEGEGGGNNSDGATASSNGVLSIFPIARSCCAFVNYETETQRDAATERFNGVPLRADPRCPLLVCRARRKDDDLRAGVGGQRGMGMHSRWVKAQAEKAASASSPHLGLSALSLDDDDVPTRPPPRPLAGGSNSSGSHASTDSSLLRQHFPQRFFILKSLTRDDLDLSTQTGVWATQKHNEGILDRAFRTSQDVFLVFSVNKSGEFYGYARMAGPVGRGDGGSVAWARRDSAANTPSARGPTSPPDAPLLSAERLVDDSPLLSASRLVDDSPAPLATPTSVTPPAHGVQSAPPVLGAAHRGLSVEEAALKGASVDVEGDGWAAARRRTTPMVLDETAPFRAARAGADARVGHVRPGNSLGSVAEAKESREREEARGEGWGQEFKLQWLCTERLPFRRTRHIRNPWNRDREVKISRDGTELETQVGHALLEEWRLYLAEGGDPDSGRS
ncbi:YT521-B-like domain-containing protein [Mycena capillaripes]|nr:YT521-B-like domain-containing protein [Mycena capillaripes]